MATRSYGIQFPLQDDTQTNRLFRLDRTAQLNVRSQLTFLLLTTKGERWFDPEFGTLLRRYIFEPQDNLSWQAVLTDIERQVARYLPGVTIQSVESSGQGHQVNLLITFVFSDGTRYQQADTLPISFGGAPAA